MEPTIPIIFDLDGTLIYQKTSGDSTQARSGHPVRDRIIIEASKHGILPSEYENVEPRMAPRWNRTLEVLGGQKRKPYEINAAMASLDRALFENELQEHDRSEAFPDSAGALRDLKAVGYTVCIVTNTSKIEMLRMLEKHGMLKYVDRYVCRDPMHFLKPHPYPCVAMLEAVGAEEALYVGDDRHDSDSFRGACDTLGVDGRFVLMNSRGYDGAAIKQIGPDAVINSPADLLYVVPRI